MLHLSQNISPQPLLDSHRPRSSTATVVSIKALGLHRPKRAIDTVGKQKEKQFQSEKQAWWNVANKIVDKKIEKTK